MKLGPFEGTTEELKDFCENHGFDPSNFLSEPPKFKFKILIIFVLILLFAIVSICIWTIDLSEIALKILTILDLILILITTATVHLRFQRWELTILTFIGSLIILSLCLNLITPKEAINDLREKTLKKDGG